jgi:hypothetical protein
MPAPRPLLCPILIGCLLGCDSSEVATSHVDGGTLEDAAAASNPPVQLAGVVLWLDGDFGVTNEGGHLRSWKDRSASGLVFEPRPLRPLPDRSDLPPLPESPGPVPDVLGSHGALRFDGITHLELATADDRVRSALNTVGRDFLLVMVLRADPSPGFEMPHTLFTFSQEGAATDEQIYRPELDLWVGDDRFNLMFAYGTRRLGGGTRTFDSRKTQLMMVSKVADRLTLSFRSNDPNAHHSWNAAPEPYGIGAPLELPFLAPLVGGWIRGGNFLGLLAEVVLVTGPGAGDAAAPVEDYLARKYGL